MKSRSNKKKNYVKRTYNRWTPEEDAMIARGEIPPTHPHYAACLLRAKKLGFTFAKKRESGIKWTKRMDDLLRTGIIPTGRSMKECTERASALGFDFVKTFFEAPVADSIRITGRTPKGMSRVDAVSAAIENNVSTKAFKVKPLTAPARSAYERGKRLFMMHATSDMSINDIADKEHMTRQNAHRLIERFKVHYFDENCFDEAVEKFKGWQDGK